MDIATKKLIVVGDGACGKTSLLIRYGTDKFLESYTPTVFDTYTVDVPVGNQRVVFYIAFNLVCLFSDSFDTL